MSTAARMLRLIRWLGPQAAPTHKPENVERRELELDEGSLPLRAVTWRSTARPAAGSLLLVPGLHFLGAADPRLDRFARILADSGLYVLAPRLTDYERLTVAPRVLAETELAFDVLRDLEPRRPPSVLSISFGSLPALRLAAARPSDVQKLVVFGGFCDFRRTLAHSLEGDQDHPHDPLNAPVSFINLIEHFEEFSSDDRARLRTQLHRQCTETWGDPAHKSPEFYVPVARRLAAELPVHLREFFLIAARAEPGTVESAFAALNRSGSAFDWLDVTPHLGRVRARVDLVHGRSDDVIPHRESIDLLARFPKETGARLHLTGLYGHTSTSSLRALGGNVRALGQELGTTMAILRALATL
jgi:pimeloyl-ACP methyl ester carboxylesterase